MYGFLTQKYISTVEQCGDIFKKNIINVIFIYIILKLLIKLFITSLVRPPVRPLVQEPLPFLVLSPVRFLKPWDIASQFPLNQELKSC